MDRSAIEDKQARAEAKQRLKKLRLETRILEGQASPESRRLDKLKGYSSVAGVITATIAGVAFFLSVYQVLENFRRSDFAAEADRFGDALTLFSEERPIQRITGATYLGTFLRPDGRYAIQSLDTLANALATESDSSVRASIVSIMDAYVTNPAVDPSALGHVLSTLTQASRATVRRYAEAAQVPLPDCRVSRSGRVSRGSPSNQDPCEVVQMLDAMSALVVRASARLPDFKDMSGIYCGGCDFSGRALDGADFSRAVLIGATFAGASLNAATFRNANILDADFTNAELRAANFAADPGHDTDYMYHRMESFAARGEKGILIEFGPDFGCADLAGADFTHHPVFQVRSAEVSADFSSPGGANFNFANLRGTKLATAKAFGVTTTVDGPFQAPMFSDPITLSDSTIFMFWMLDKRSELQVDLDSPYRIYFGNIWFHLARTNWQEAELPVGIKAVMKIVEEEKAAEPQQESPWFYGSGEPPLTAPANCVGITAASSPP